MIRIVIFQFKTFRSRLHEAADVILKLQLIAQELPADKFAPALNRIEAKYLEIQTRLIDDFVKSQRSNDLPRMKHLAAILSQFKRYNACVDEFIDGQIQSSSQGGGGGGRASLIVSSRAKPQATKDVFKDIVPLCNASWKTISQVILRSV